MTAKLNRRQFLQNATTAAAGLTLYFNVPHSAHSEGGTPAPYRPNSRLSIHNDGRVEVHIEKAEMGQGIATALAQIVAEELEADWSEVTATLNTYTADQGFVFTASSLSVFTSFQTISRAAAAVRLMLLETAADHWGVDVSRCKAVKSRVISGDRSLSFSDLVALKPKQATMSADELAKIPLKEPGRYSVIGTGNPSPHQTAKARGALDYGIDKRLPGMVYAKVLYPPSVGATHAEIDDTAAKNVRGFLQTVVNPHVVAVVAESYPAAVEARDALAIKWTPGPNSQVNSSDLWTTFKDKITGEEGRPWVRRGDATRALKRAARTLSKTYSTDLVAHLQMEPYNCTAEYRNGEVHLYCGTQYPTRLVSQCSEMCGVDPSKVFVHGQYMGGGFGALLETEWHAHAGVIAKAVGRPVKLMLSREEDTANDAFRSPTLHQLTCGLDAADGISGWEHRVVGAWPSSRHTVFLNKDGMDSYALSGADHYYNIADQHVRAVEHDLGPPVGYVRGVACGYMFFAIESFMDELAHETQQDPLEMRLALLKDRPRLAHVLRRASQRGGWGQSIPTGTGVGLAAITAQDSEANTTRIGALVRARVDLDRGDIRVEKVSCVVDCGVVINPDGAMAMAEGALLYGLSIAIKGGGTLERGRIVERNFDTYPVLRMSEVPELDIEFVESKHPPTGMGEPTMACIAPALANAVYAATGKRVRQLPMTPDRVKATPIES